MTDLINRLRGNYAMGPHLPNGNPEFGWRQFETTPICKEAANRIEELESFILSLNPCIDHDAIITNEKEVWVVWTNSDITEGKGVNKVLHVCEKYATAERLGKNQYVMGTDCPLSKSKAYKINNRWFIDGDIINPTEEDKIRQEKLDKTKEVFEKAKSLGLSEEELEFLMTVKN